MGNDRILADCKPEIEPGTVVGVIDVGSSSIRLIVAEILGPGSWRKLVVGERPVALGQDVFAGGAIRAKTMKACVRALSGFQELMAGYGAAVIKAIGTSAVRQASNRDTFIDHVRVRTGIQIEVLEGIDATYLTYLATIHCLHDYQPRLKRAGSIIMEVGGGGTEVMLMRRGRMIAAHTLGIGTMRLRQQLREGLRHTRKPERLLLQDVHRNVETVNAEQPLADAKRFVALGSDARLVAEQVGKRVDENYATVGKEAFTRFVDRVSVMTEDEIVSVFNIAYSEAELLLPALLVFRAFLEATSATRVVVPSVSIRDGVLLDISRVSDPQVQQELARQIVASAKSLGRRYQVDEAHARHVCDTALRLFDAIPEEHGLGLEHRVQLEVAALLHDIGTFISPSQHHKHGQYIIESSDLFGLNRESVRVVANVVRYHRRRTPSPSHERFMALPPEKRVVVIKLAAIMRVADALDRGHRGHVSDFTIEKGDDRLTIRCRRIGDTTLEKMSLSEKAGMFEETYGLKVVLV